MKRYLFLSFVIVFLATTYSQQMLPNKVWQFLHHIDRYPLNQHEALRPVTVQTQLDSLITNENNTTRVLGRYFGYDNHHRSLWENYINFVSGESDSLFYQYNTAGNLTYSEYAAFDASHTLTNKNIHINTYDAQQRIVVETDSSFVGGVWDASRYVYSNFNSSNLPTRIIDQDYDASAGQYVNIMRGDVTYDTQSRITEVLIYVWNDSNSSWDTYAKLVRNFDSQGRMVQEVIKIWASITWYDYDEKNINITTNGGNEVHTIVHRVRNGTNWENVEKDIYEFDGTTGKIVRTEHYEWDDSTSQWVGTTKNVSVYSTSGSRLSVQTNYFVWDSTANNWPAQATSRWISEYDTSVPGTQIAWPNSFNNFDYHERLFGRPWLRYHQPFTDYKLLYAENYYYDSGTSSWVLIRRDDFYYGPLMNVSDSEILGFRVAPNPFTHSTVFSWNPSESNLAQLQIFDLTGKPVWSGEIGNGQKIYLTDLPSGIYVFRLYNKNGSVSGKLLKK